MNVKVFFFINLYKILDGYILCKLINHYKRKRAALNFAPLQNHRRSAKARIKNAAAPPRRDGRRRRVNSASFRLFYKAEQLPVRDAYEHASQRDEVVGEAVAHALRKIEFVVAARRGEAREVVDVLIAREPRLAEDVGTHREYPRADAAGLTERR